MSDPNMTVVNTTASCGHAAAVDGCLACLENAIAFDEARKKSTAEYAVSLLRPPNAMAESQHTVREVEAHTVSEMIAILMEHVGETGKSESAVEVLQRLSKFWKDVHRAG